MRHRLRAVAVAALVAILLVAGGSAVDTPEPDEAPAASAPVAAVTPTLVKRATLPADHLADGPPSGARVSPANGRTGPFPGQLVPGFSAMVANGDGTFWAMPDNGFGARANSADFLLRLYLVQPAWETARGGAGKITVQRFISLQDPDHKIDFPLVNENTSARMLTGADFDVESVVRGADGSFWIGDEFGPFLIHVSATGRVLSAPVAFPRGKSLDSPDLEPGQTPLVPRSRGFEAMAGSADGRYLYPILEGALANDADPRRRMISQFDVRRNRYTGRTWSYQTDQAANVVSDAQLTDSDELLVIERDDLEGAEAVTKRVYRVDLTRPDADGFVTKALAVDLLKIANPTGIGTGSSPDAYGVAKQFSFPFRSVETLVPLPNGHLLLGNDTNHPDDDTRHPGRADATELIELELREVAVAAPTTVLVAHRGASGYRPEHTLAAYALAIRMCAEYIEPDVVPTKDGVLVARHENEIGGTTNVATLSRFADRRTTKTVDGVPITGWFTEDFTLAELKTLRARERLPLVRPDSAEFDGRYEIPTVDEVVDLARHSTTCSGRRVGVFPETKHPTYFQSLGLPLERRLLDVLESDGYGQRSDPVFIQSYETTNLQQLASQTSIPLVQLIDCVKAPYDLVARGDRRTYVDLATREGLRTISGYADSVGVCKDVMIPRTPAGTLAPPTPVIADAHSFGLSVLGFAFRRENQFLPVEFQGSDDPNGAGDLVGEIQVFRAAGMDGFFADNPDLGYQAALRPPR